MALTDKNIGSSSLGLHAVGGQLHGFRNRGCHPMVGIAIAQKCTH